VTLPFDDLRWKASAHGLTPATILQDRYRRARAEGDSQFTKPEKQAQALSHLEDVRDQLRRLEVFAGDDMANEAQVLRLLEKMSKSLSFALDWMGEAHGS
jgi:hypothetical protein